MKDFRYFEDAASLELDAGACVGCGLCVQVCPHGVLVLRDGRAVLADPGACMECGACARNCAAGAVCVTPGVGCAAYIIQTWLPKALRRNDEGCC
ncbi:mercury methylation ferredoxin HgcB [Desulfocurvus sp. DL9XJH121]